MFVVARTIKVLFVYYFGISPESDPLLAEIIRPYRDVFENKITRRDGLCGSLLGTVVL